MGSCHGHHARECRGPARTRTLRDPWGTTPLVIRRLSNFGCPNSEITREFTRLSGRPAPTGSRQAGA